jgi:hypothetical protein
MGIQTMRGNKTNLARMLSGVALGAVLSGGASAADVDNPYHTIVDRNVFDLKPPAPPPEPKDNKDEKKAPSTIKFTGWTTLFGPVRALFMVQEPATPGKGGGPAKDIPIDLKVGMAESGVELLAVDQENGTAKIKHNGEVVTLTLAQPPASGAPGGAGTPGGPPGPGGHPGGGPGGRVGNPGVPQLGAPGQAIGGSGQLRTPNFFQPQGGGGAVGASGGIGGVAPAFGGGLEAGLNSIPSRDVRTQQPSQAAQAGPASAEEAALMLEANRLLAATEPHPPPLPPPAPGVEQLLGQNANGANGTTPTTPSNPLLPFLGPRTTPGIGGR